MDLKQVLNIIFEPTLHRYVVHYVIQVSYYVIKAIKHIVTTNKTREADARHTDSFNPVLRQSFTTHCACIRGIHIHSF